MNEDILVVIFSGNAMEAEMVKNLLEEHGIQSCIRNQNMGTIAPWYISAGGHSPVDVEVLESDKDAAMELIGFFQQEQ